MNNFGGTVNIKSTTNCGVLYIFIKAKAPACNCFRTTTDNSFDTTSVATHQLLTECPDR